jgi:hypothetical protein
MFKYTALASSLSKRCPASRSSKSMKMLEALNLALSRSPNARLTFIIIAPRPLASLAYCRHAKAGLMPVSVSVFKGTRHRPARYDRRPRYGRQHLD